MHLAQELQLHMDEETQKQNKKKASYVALTLCLVLEEASLLSTVIPTLMWKLTKEIEPNKDERTALLKKGNLQRLSH